MDINLVWYLNWIFQKLCRNYKYSTGNHSNKRDQRL